MTNGYVRSDLLEVWRLQNKEYWRCVRAWFLTLAILIGLFALMRVLTVSNTTLFVVVTSYLCHRQVKAVKKTANGLAESRAIFVPEGIQLTTPEGTREISSIQVRSVKVINQSHGTLFKPRYCLVIEANDGLTHRLPIAVTWMGALRIMEMIREHYPGG